jgi:hypothetical protein
LGVTALSALGGLLAEAQVDFSVHRVAHSMQNVSTTFLSIQGVSRNVSSATLEIRAKVDDMLLSFNNTLPDEASQLAIVALTYDTTL